MESGLDRCLAPCAGCYCSTLEEKAKRLFHAETGRLAGGAKRFQGGHSLRLSVRATEGGHPTGGTWGGARAANAYIYH